MKINDMIKEATARMIERETKEVNVVVVSLDEEYLTYWDSWMDTIDRDFTVDIMYQADGIPDGSRMPVYIFKGTMGDLIEKLDSE